MLGLTYARKLKGLSQDDFGRIIGVNHCTVSNWERGLNAVPKARIVTLARILGCPMDFVTKDLSKDEMLYLNTLINSAQNDTVKKYVLVKGGIDQFTKKPNPKNLEKLNGKKVFNTKSKDKEFNANAYLCKIAGDIVADKDINTKSLIDILKILTA